MSLFKIHTQEELNAKSAEELQAIQQELQGLQQNFSALAQTELDKVTTAIAAKAAAVANKVKEDVEKAEEKTVSWWDAHRDDVYKIIGLALLAYIAVKGMH